MKPWLKRTLIGVFGVSLLAGGLTACGHRHHGQGWQASAEDVAKWRERALDKAGRELQLDEAQKLKLGTLFDKLNEQRSALVGANPNPRSEMSALIAGERFDKARAQSLIEEKTNAVRSKSPEVVAAAGDFFDSLKPEQQQKVREFMQHRHGRWGWRG